jgi:hypothetical protein
MQLAMRGPRDSRGAERTHLSRDAELPHSAFAGESVPLERGAPAQHAKPSRGGAHGVNLAAARERTAT